MLIYSTKIKFCNNFDERFLWNTKVEVLNDHYIVNHSSYVLGYYALSNTELFCEE